MDLLTKTFKCQVGRCSTRRVGQGIRAWRLVSHLVRVLIAVIPLVLPYGQTVRAQATTGSIAGTIVDARTGEALIGAQVVIEGTTLGAAADLDGNYRIISVPPGEHTLRAMFVGYTTIVRQEVEVSTGLTSRQDFEMTEATIEGEEVVVTAERPRIQKDLTSSQQHFTNQQIQAAPLEDVGQLISLQAGIVTVEPTERPGAVDNAPGDGLHIRGGRENETVFLIDGIRVDNPVWGGAIFGQNNFGSAIEEMTTVLGTFNAEYGGRMSGVINLVTRRPSDRLEVMASGYTDNIGLSAFTRDTYQGDFLVSGPIAPGLRIVASLQGRTTDGRFRGYAIPERTDLKGQNGRVDEHGNPIGDEVSADWEDELHGLVKLTWQPFAGMNVMGSYVRSHLRGLDYDHDYKYHPSGMPWEDNLSEGITLKLTHQIARSTFYEAYGARQRMDFWSGVHKTREMRIVMGGRDEDIDGFYYAGADQDYRADSVLSWQAGISLTSQLSNVHQMKVGYDFRSLDLFHRNDVAWTTAANQVVIGLDDAGNPIYRWYENHKAYVRKVPTEMSAYVQDKMEFDGMGMVVNVGLRWERWKIPLAHMADPNIPFETELIPTNAKMRLSPRLGVSYPISDRAAFHFAYGHFYQFPNYVNMLSSINERGPNPDRPNLEDIEVAVFNPDMKPEKSVTYEAGVQVGLTDALTVRMTAYYRTMSDLVGVQWVRTAGYVLYDNVDFGNSKGVEIVLDQRIGDILSTRINYTLAQTLISSSSPVVAAQTVGTTPLPFRTELADWDRTHDFSALVLARLPGWWKASLISNIRSGRPYTVLAEQPNTERMPTFIDFDARVTKGVVFAGLEHELYVQVDNLFNRRNIYSVYALTGRWDDDGDPGTPYAVTADPKRLSDGRTLRVGYKITY